MFHNVVRRYLTSRLDLDRAFKDKESAQRFAELRESRLQDTCERKLFGVVII